MNSKWLSGGKLDPLPFKSLILLKMMDGIGITFCFLFHSFNKEKLNAKITYKSVRLVKAEVVEGIGPSREHP